MPKAHIGRPLAPRGVLHPQFRAAVAAARMPLRTFLAFSRTERRLVKGWLAGKPVPVTACVLVGLRRVAAAIGYEGSLLEAR